MRLSKEDKYELARAAIKARDLESLRDYIVSVVDAFDDLPPGKADVPCPRYAVAAGGGLLAVTANGHLEGALL